MQGPLHAELQAGTQSVYAVRSERALRGLADLRLRPCPGADSGRGLLAKRASQTRCRSRTQNSNASPNASAGAANDPFPTYIACDCPSPVSALTYISPKMYVWFTPIALSKPRAVRWSRALRSKERPSATWVPKV